MSCRLGKHRAAGRRAVDDPAGAPVDPPADPVDAVRELLDGTTGECPRAGCRSAYGTSTIAASARESGDRHRASEEPRHVEAEVIGDIFGDIGQ